LKLDVRARRAGWRIRVIEVPAISRSELLHLTARFSRLIQHSQVIAGHTGGLFDPLTETGRGRRAIGLEQIQ